MSEADEDSLSSIMAGSSAFHSDSKPSTSAAPAAADADPTPKPAAPADGGKETGKAGQPRDPSGKFAGATEGKADEAKPAAGEGDEPAPATTEGKEPDKPLTRADVAAIIDERRKRQETERQLAQLLQQQQQGKAGDPPPSVFENEEAAIRSRVAAETAPLRNVVLQQSVTIAQMKYGESWKEAEDAFYEAAAANPQLVEAFRNAIDPGEFVYQQGISHKVLAQHGGNLVAAIEAAKAESKTQLDQANTRMKALEAEIAELKKAGADVAALNDSLHGRASAQVTADTVADDEDISSIARFGKTA